MNKYNTKLVKQLVKQSNKIHSRISRPGYDSEFFEELYTNHDELADIILQLVNSSGEDTTKYWPNQFH